MKCPKCDLNLCVNSCMNINSHTEECSLLQNLKLSNRPSDASFPLSLLSCLTPLRSLLLNQEDQEVVKNLKSHRGRQHGKEIECLINQFGMKISDDEKNYLIFVCSVLDANAFEVVIGDEQYQTSLRGE